jgi:hypothetical protein
MWRRLNPFPRGPHRKQLCASPGVALAEAFRKSPASPSPRYSAPAPWEPGDTTAPQRNSATDCPGSVTPPCGAFVSECWRSCFLKDTFGAATPAPLKKPLDLLELFENKLSAIIASAAIIPFIAAQMAQAFADAPPASSTLSGDVHYGSVLPLAFSVMDLRLLFVPLALFAFAVVWITSHAVNVLIVLSPFGFLDAALKLIKTSVLSSVAVACLVNPFLGAALSLLIICLAAWIAPRALRFAVFGTLLALDILMPWRARKHATPQEAHVFTARRLAGIPTRTFGRLSCSADGTVQFTYRPWAILGRRTVDLPAAPVTICRGLLYPTLLQPCGPASWLATTFVFLPRYRGHEEMIAEHLSAREIRDHSMARGFAAIRAFLADTFGGLRSTRLTGLAQTST